MVEARRLLPEDNAQLNAHRSTVTSYAMRKVVIVGDTGVGKTAILSRFVTG